MIEYITAPGAVHRIQEIIDDAETCIVLVSPFLKLAPNIAERLRAADQREVKSAIVYGKEDRLDDDVQSLLSSLKHLSLRYYQDLHAKCYLNERGMVITSMNLYEFSQRNREMGIYVTSEEEVYQKAAREVRQILDNAEKKRLSKVGKMTDMLVGAFKSGSINGSGRRPDGSCIRCSRDIRLNPGMPLCDRCYNTWSQFGNPDYLENYCHTCGDAADTSYARPLCWKCFKASAA